MLLRIAVKATGRVRVDAALLHLRAARLHAEVGSVRERQYEWPATQGIVGDHFAGATGAVLSAACAMEGALNECYQDAVDGCRTALVAADSAREEIHDF